MKLFFYAIICSTIYATLAASLLGCQSGNKTSSNKASGITPTHEQILLGPMEVYIEQGKRSGEAYFSKDGNEVIFQSEVDAKNPFYQIYLKDLKSGKIKRVSNGSGKTTCSWILPDNKGFIYSSTHEDPDFDKKAEEEIALRNSPDKRRYSWDYDPSYEIYKVSKDLSSTTKLSNALGYDAEASASPDGKYIVFASNRHAYSQKLSNKDKEKLKKDPSYFLEIYRMDADGTNLKRLTYSAGYDGGPFFSPDGESIVWRRFSQDGRTAEVYTMSADGKNEKQITKLGSMSWAPFYHPSGDYIVFTTPSGDHRNFELFIVDTEGLSQPVQVTYLDGFDGLPVFTPDGSYLTWNRPTNEGKTQVFRAKWNHELAIKSLGLTNRFPLNLKTEINTDDLAKLVKYLSAEELAGRMTGSKEEAQYTAAIANYFKKIGLSPYRGEYIHEYKYPKSSKLLKSNSLTLLGKEQVRLAINKDWIPSNNSKSGQVSATEIIFAGYGFYNDDYNSYRNIDVKAKWVMLTPDLPKAMDKSEKLKLLPYSTQPHKVKVAQELGAIGVIFVTDEDLAFNSSPAEAFDIPIIYLSQAGANIVLKDDKLNFKSLKSNADKDPNTTAIELKSKLTASTQISREYATGRNVLGLLKGNTSSIVTIGAHGDHLGYGKFDSLKKSSDKKQIHFGADDNASGVSAILEVANKMASDKGKRRANVLFAVWSGEELGNLGSQAFLKDEKRRLKQFKAYLNLDMVGRMTNEAKLRPLIVQGLGSGENLTTTIDRNKGDLSISTTEDPYLPTDAISFYLKEIPVISLFTGTHQDYHSPRDTYDKIDYIGLKKIADFSYRLTDDLANNYGKITYKKVERKNKDTRYRFKIYLGTIPDYTYQGNGVRLSGVVKSSPAEVAGLQEGDIIISYDGESVKNLQDYMKSLSISETDKSYVVQIQRADKFLSLNVKPKNKDAKSDSGHSKH